MFLWYFITVWKDSLILATKGYFKQNYYFLNDIFKQLTLHKLSDLNLNLNIKIANKNIIPETITTNEKKVQFYY